MPYDLEADVLRAVSTYADFDLGELRELVATIPRLGHPLLGHVLEGLIASLVRDGMLEPNGDRFVLTERARAWLVEQPSVLG